jgi:Icc protein
MATLIAQITDTHLLGDPDACLRGIPSRAHLIHVLEDVATHQPDWYLFTGDIADRGEPAAYEQFEALTGGLPKGVVPGNHDHPDRWRDPQCYEVGGWRMLLLSSVWEQSRYGEGRLSGGSLAWLGQQLGVSALPTLIALHHPPVLVGMDWVDQMGLANAAELWQVIGGHDQVKLILFGHIHHAFATVYQGVTCYGTPSSHSQLQAPRDPGYRLLWLEAGGEHRTEVVFLQS